MKKRRAALLRRLGPVGLSLVSAAVTAIGFAAVSLAADTSGSSSSDNGSNQTYRTGPAPPGGRGGVMFQDNLSAADRQKMDDFRTCMEDNGAPAPPSHIDPSTGPPKPPTAADQQALQKAFEACKAKLPADMQKAGPPQIGTCRAGAPPGAPGAPGAPNKQKQGTNQNQSNSTSSSNSGSTS